MKKSEFVFVIDITASILCFLYGCCRGVIKTGDPVIAMASIDILLQNLAFLFIGVTTVFFVGRFIREKQRLHH